VRAGRLRSGIDLIVKEKTLLFSCGEVFFVLDKPFNGQLPKPQEPNTIRLKMMRQNDLSVPKKAINDPAITLDRHAG
jgi:hypothetical protein